MYNVCYQVPGVADAGEGAGPDVRRHGALRLHHHADQPREEAGGVRGPVLELQSEPESDVTPLYFDGY